MSNNNYAKGETMTNLDALDEMLESMSKRQRRLATNYLLGMLYQIVSPAIIANDLAKAKSYAERYDWEKESERSED